MPRLAKPPQEGIMDDAEVKRIAGYIEDLENSFVDTDCRKPATCRQLIKLHLTIERLGDRICQTKDERVKSTLAALADKARRCQRCMESRVTVHN
jgi:hypothetical protein